MAEYDQSRTKAESRQMEILSGKMVRMIEGSSEDLEGPGAQEAIIAVTSTVLALACFCLARLVDQSNSHHG